jgi:hypothetical protein
MLQEKPGPVPFLFGKKEKQTADEYQHTHTRPGVPTMPKKTPPFSCNDRIVYPCHGPVLRCGNPYTVELVFVSAGMRSPFHEANVLLEKSMTGTTRRPGDRIITTSGQVLVISGLPGFFTSSPHSNNAQDIQGSKDPE